MSDAIARSLSDAKVRNAKPAEKPFKLADGGGLFVLVQPNGAKLWRYKFRIHGTEGLLAIGAYPDLGLKEARAAHLEARALVASGVNPVRSRKDDRENAAMAELQSKAGAFENVLAEWRQVTDKGLARETLRQRNNAIAKDLLPAFKGRSIDSITRADIRQLIKRVEARAPQVAKNCRGWLDSLFEYAVDAGLAKANPVPPGRILARLTPKSHTPMATERVPAFLDKLDASTATYETRTAMNLVVLTALRKNEVTGASWDEFDLDAGEWTIPADRMKARREHWVPLSAQAVALLRELRSHSREGQKFLFPHRDKAKTPMAERTLNMLLLRLGYAGDTVHGFRSMFSTHFNQAKANPDVIERCLAHAPADKVRAAYNRHDYKEERRELMQQWADHLDAKRLPLKLAA